MKVYAESQPAKTVPYLHLGYLAATPSPAASGGIMAAGVVLTLVGALMVFKLGVGKSAEGVARRWLQFRGTRWQGIGRMTAVTGVFLIALGIIVSRGSKSRMKQLTTFRMTVIGRELSYSFAEGGEDIRGVKDGEYELAAFMRSLPDYHRVSGHSTNYTKDARDRPMRVVVSKQDKACRLTFVGAGEDGRFGTPDDVRYTNDVPVVSK